MEQMKEVLRETKEIKFQLTDDFPGDQVPITPRHSSSITPRHTSSPKVTVPKITAPKVTDDSDETFCQVIIKINKLLPVPIIGNISTGCPIQEKFIWPTCTHVHDCM